MTDPKNIEGPEDIDPAHLAVGKTAEGLLKDPGSYIKNDDGTKTHIVPAPFMLEWQPIALVADPDNCQHAFSICAECADSWAIDYFIRFFDGDKCIFLSPDHPDFPGA